MTRPVQLSDVRLSECADGRRLVILTGPAWAFKRVPWDGEYGWLPEPIKALWANLLRRLRRCADRAWRQAREGWEERNRLHCAQWDEAAARVEAGAGTLEDCWRMEFMREL